MKRRAFKNYINCFVTVLYFREKKKLVSGRKSNIKKMNEKKKNRGGYDRRKVRNPVLAPRIELS